MLSIKIFLTFLNDTTCNHIQGNIVHYSMKYIFYFIIETAIYHYKIKLSKENTTTNNNIIEITT